MSNWICDKCGATYIDVSHQEPSVLKQEIEIRKLKELLKECRERLGDYAEFCIKEGFLNAEDEAVKTIIQIDEVLK